MQCDDCLELVIDDGLLHYLLEKFAHNSYYVADFCSDSISLQYCMILQSQTLQNTSFL